MTSSTFVNASRALRVKRRAFSTEITEFVEDAYTRKDMSLEAFSDQKKYFEDLLDQIVNATNDFVKLVDDDDKGDLKENLADGLEGLRHKKDSLNWLEMDLKKWLADTGEVKNVEIDAADVTLSESEVEGDKVGNGKLVDLQVDSKAKC